MELSACIVVYNGCDEALKAAQTVLQYTRRHPLTLYLVDNASPDGSGARLEAAVKGGTLSTQPGQKVEVRCRKEIYDEVGGLDESYAVAFNDVDFCVRVRQAGYTNVFTPFAQLYHYESKSRGMEDNPEKQKRFQGEVLRFQARWGDLLAAGDPCTNPNFDIQREDFSLKILPLE